MFEANQVDEIFSIGYTEQRAKIGVYPQEVLIMSPCVIWTHADSSLSYEKFADLKGKRVGIVEGYSYTKEFLDYIQANTLALHHSSIPPDGDA